MKNIVPQIIFKNVFNLKMTFNQHDYFPKKKKIPLKATYLATKFNSKSSKGD